ncbi:uncharacterized protein Z520_07734 [Fonsecaea multimorphosa CBS 102226]|uniref:Nucleoporin Nup82 n=1 Tax=Fonsecaea multimorphosa CBS 102226 TaxID=1442371 RepID=A0A0D2KIN0_9EURO|nr:uncharacterized protein Z520_07734 [Fonsecaea multimorphosa CBS 102226]KIX96468.1 hypothetical protein Z520_07734 [Fonsecaea multimorphosa CBS 102226]OAL28331.1 hypothetical protein AYO22_03037 [Fonsecaea multimorphosa]
MPKVIGYTPPFLSRPSPGSRIFTDPEPQSPASPSKRSSYLGALPSTQYQGPRRLVASRGTEIFTVVGNKVRWADLSAVRDEWEDNTQSGASRFGQSRSDATETTGDSVYRTLAVPVYYQIRQISISPSGLFLAICTEHTVHIAVLPDSSRLKEHARSPLKVKTYQLGPTVHVIPESPLASVLWHPLACATASTDCLVTVTAEAAVRVWEFDKANSWSLDRPKLSIDLRKLADGVSCDQDFEPSGFGKTRGFSVDDFDMEASAACFGGRGREDEDAWASMTLWVAMRNGDLYALCPLLPSRWKPTSTTIPSLTTTAVSRMASINDDETDMDERRAADQQYEWVQEIDNEEPQIHQSIDSLGEFEIRYRPQNPSAIPRLQGPFTIVPEEDASEIEVSDIHVFPAKLDEQDLFDGEDYDEIDPGLVQPISFTTICVATPENQVWFAIDLDGVTGQWLPKKGKSAFGVPSSDATPLTLIDVVTLDGTTTDPATNWPVFTPDIAYNCSIFVTTQKHVYAVSLDDWVTQLGAELSGTEPVDLGLKTRLETRCQNQVCLTDKLIEVREPSEALSAPTTIDDTSLGYFLLTATSNAPYGVVFDQAPIGTSIVGPSTTDFTMSSSHLEAQFVNMPGSPIETIPAREPYCPPKIFYFNQHIPIDSMRQRLPPHLKKVISERPMRLSPAMLEIMTFTHRTVGVQSAGLENAAAELFRRCERLRIELAGQVKQMTELAQQLQRLTATTEEDENGNVKERKTPETRINEARERQSKLVARYEALRRKVGHVGSANRELSSKELAWMHEIDSLGQNVGIVGKEDGEQEAGRSDTTLDKRFETVKQLTRSLVEEAHSIEKQQQQSPASPKGPPGLDASMSSISASSITPSMSASQITLTSRSSGAAASPRSSNFGGLGISSRLQKESIADIMATVEREGAVIEAAMKRLERLKMEY